MRTAQAATHRPQIGRQWGYRASLPDAQGNFAGAVQPRHTNEKSLVGPMGFEPITYGLKVRSSTVELEALGRVACALS